MASLERFERSTNCLEGSRSVLLSYRDISNTLKFYDNMNSNTSHCPASVDWLSSSSTVTVTV